MIDQLTSMAVFVKTAESGSFTSAAKVLGMTSQMAGKHVDALEKRLGARLLHRSTRRQSLTDAGRQYLEGCRRVLAEAAEADARVLSQADHPRGMLRVTAPVAFGACHLMPEITAFLAAHPEVTIDLTLSDRQFDLVEEGFDVAFRIGSLPASRLIARPLTPYRLIACAAPDYLAKHGVPRHPRELDGHECLGYMFDSHPAPATWTFIGPDGMTTVEPSHRLRANDARTLIDAAVAGSGIVLGGEPNVQAQLSSGQLVAILTDFQAPVRPLHLLYPEGRSQPRKQRAFIEWMMRDLASPMK